MSRCKPVTATQILFEIDDAHKRNYIKENFTEQGIFSPTEEVVDLLTNAGARELRKCNDGMILFAIPKSWESENDIELMRRLFTIPTNTCKEVYEARFVVPVDNGCNDMDLCCLYNIRKRYNSCEVVETGMAHLKTDVSKSQSWYKLTDKIRALIVC